MRRFVIAGNWKMHKNVAETSAFIEGLTAAALSTAVDVLIGPPTTSLPSAAMLLTGSPIGLAAQNCHWETSGAFTGEVSAAMLAELGVGWVIVGHSERRTLFAETDRTARDRARAAQAAGLEVIYCIGETLEEREAERTFDVLQSQTDGLGALDPAHLVVAYEPVWAIGTGVTASPEQAQEAHAFIRSCFERAFSAADAAAIRILYGGSMKPSNASDLLSKPDVDGGLIGGASLDVDSFSAIIRAAADCAAGE
ncbi:MAG: triose-phosphate isomerase [Thermoanaerobaculales bacterium]|jgi:triosephosphate isomerase|nr:triose-phosphate isomerase [Thermoanaerobaculales bacterium]